MVTRSTITSLKAVGMHPEPHVGAMPDTRDVNFYEADPYLRFLLWRRLDHTEYTLLEAQLRALGSRIGNDIEDFAAEADRQTPALVQRTKRGERVDEVVPSPAYRALERILYGEYAMAALSMRPGTLREGYQASLMANDALIYLAEQAESGLFCPLSMTRALARTLMKFASPEIQSTYVPPLLTTDMEQLFTGAMFLTEKQGGSDLGMVETTAVVSTSLAGWWELSGEKWFCSNVGADLMLVLARPVGAPAGTRGLGLFLLPRLLPDGRRNSYVIERLKDKLGVRSFASGEVTLDHALALLIGGPGSGWHQMTEMVNITRLGCASASAALARRSFVEAIVHARGRVAFGRPLAELPLMREQLLNMQVDVEAQTALFFEGSWQLTQADAGDAEAAVLARILIPLAKYHVTDESRRVVEAGIEVRGGNGYIEDWPNARLLRDVEVQAIWEGTGNISALDVGRALRQPGAAERLISHYRSRISLHNDGTIARAAHLCTQLLDDAADQLSDMLTRPREEQEVQMVIVTRFLARVITAALLVEDAIALVREQHNYRSLAIALRYLRRYLIPVTRATRNLPDRLPLDHFDAIIDWTPTLNDEACLPLLHALEADARA